MTWPAIIVVVGVWLTLSYLVLFDAAIERWRRERAELRRVGGRVRVEPSRINQVRRDPSPRPREDERRA